MENVYQDIERKRQEARITDPLIRAELRFIQRYSDFHKPEALKGEMALTEDNVRAYFEALREDILDSYSRDNSPDSIEIADSELEQSKVEELEAVAQRAQYFMRWLREESPVARLRMDLVSRGCSPRTLQCALSVTNRYLRFTNYDPQFTEREVTAYFASLSSLAANSIAVHRTWMKTWFEVLGLPWPLTRKMRHRIEIKEPPAWTPEQIVDIVERVRLKGTARDKYYICLATTWAPRASELAQMTANNFVWNGDSGVLKFQPLKQGSRPRLRVHSIPPELVPYLKGYSQEAKPISTAKFIEYFHALMHRLGIKLPEPPLRAPDAVGSRRKMKGHGWHSFRHALTTALFQEGLDEPTVRMWMGWTSEPTIAFHYFRPDPQSIDQRVLERHPFLKLWE